MERDIKNIIERISDGSYQYLPLLKIHVIEYIVDFTFDKKIYDYTHVSFVFKAYPIILRFYPLDAKIINQFIIKVCDHTILDFQNLNENETDAINNFQSHRLKVVSTGGLILKSKGYLDWCEKEIKNFIGKNLKADGSCLDFYLRDSVTYVTYTLGPLVETCLNLVNSDKPNYYFYVHPEKGSSIAKSVKWLLPYITGAKTNKMFMNSIYISDKNKKEYSQIWDKSDALNLINLCINFDRTYIGLYRV
jgi:hypothetical protein